MTTPISPIQKIEANNKRLAEIEQERLAHLIEATAWMISKDNGRDSVEESMEEANAVVNNLRKAFEA